VCGGAVFASIVEFPERERGAMDTSRKPHEQTDEMTHERRASEGLGGIAGGATGAAVGALAGPIGALVGVIAGALGGWWIGRTSADTAPIEEMEEELRAHHASGAGQPADTNYERVRPLYWFGAMAAVNPDYAGRNYEEIEPDLRRGWTAAMVEQYGSWESVRGVAREGFVRRRAGRWEGTPRTETPTQQARDRLHADDTAI
jgi:hypothetical protein